MKVDLITVVFRDELSLLKIQARSIHNFVSPDNIGTIFVIVNDADPVALLIDPKWWGVHAPEVVIIPYSKFGYTTTVSGWCNQQLCKLLAAANATSNWSVVLDAKTWFVQKYNIDAMFGNNGKPRVGLNPIDPYFESSRDFIEQLYSIKMDSMLGPGGVPFWFNTLAVKGMIAKFDNFISFFESHCTPPTWLTEFTLYSGFLISNKLPLYSEDRLYVCTNIADRTVDEFGTLFKQMHHQNNITASIHIRAYNLLGEDRFRKWANFLFERNLIDDPKIELSQFLDVPATPVLPPPDLDRMGRPKKKYTSNIHIVGDTVIPICYMPGAAGHFLTAYLTLAKNNEKRDIKYEFSEHGNCHNIVHNHRDCMKKSVTDEVENGPLQIIDTFTKRFFIFNKESLPPFFVGMHVKDFEAMLFVHKIFKKMIYTTQDCPEYPDIVARQCDYDLGGIISQPNPTLLRDAMFSPTMAFNDWVSKNKPTGVLQLPLAELLDSTCVEKITNTISNFIEIPYSQFDLDFFRTWQKATLDGIQKPIKTQ